MAPPASAKPRSRRRWILRAVLALLGVGLLGGFVYSAGPGEIARNLTRIGWGFGWLVLLSLLWRSLAATGMWLLIGAEASVPWWKVMLIRTAGESLNALMPFGNVGGEPVKAVLLARELGGPKATGIVLLDKTIFFIGSLLFMTSGTVVGAFLLADHPEVLAGVVALLVPWVGMLGWIIWRQAKGDLLLQLSRLAAALRLPLGDKLKQKLERIDAVMSAFWARGKGRFLASLAVHTLARVLRAADVWLCVALLGESISWTGAYFTAAAGMLVSTTFFFIPGALGASEGGHAFVFDLIGLGVAAGVTVGLVRRIRNYFISALAYGLVVWWPDAKPARDEPAPDAPAPEA